MLINQSQHSHNSIRYNSNISIATVESIPELNQGPQLWFKIFFITTSLSSTILGTILLFNKNYYLPSYTEFAYMKYLLLFIYIYTLGSLSALIIGTVLGGIIVFILNIIRLFQTKKDKHPTTKNQNNNNDNNQLSNRSSYSYLNRDDDISCITYSFVLFIIMDIVMYYIAVPWTILLIVKMINQLNYTKKFGLIYLFLVVNLGIGIVFISVSLFSIFGSKVSLKKNKYIVFDEDVERVHKEVKEAYKEFHQNKNQPDLGIELGNLD